MESHRIRSLLNIEKWDVETFLEKFYDGRLNIYEADQVIQDKEKEVPEENSAGLSSIPSERSSPLIQQNSQRRSKRINALKSSQSSAQKENKNPPKNEKTLGKTRQQNKRKATTSAVEAPSKRSKDLDGKPKAFCGICLESFSIQVSLKIQLIRKRFSHYRYQQELCQMACKHILCYDCLGQYFSNVIENSLEMCFGIKCPGYGCDSLLSDELVLNQLNNKMKGKYQQLITNGFVRSNRLIKWCLAPGCTKAIKVGEVNQPAVRCDCGYCFCFKCTQEIHDLIPCKLLDDFAKAKEENIETASWLVTNSKQCPRCRVDIEKNGGCNHITCRACSHEFCWICSAVWEKHYSCVSGEAVSFQTHDLRRLVDLNNKHQTMIQSIKFDEKMFKSSLELQGLEQKEQWIKIDFVKEAAEVLLRCRRTLADSFIFAYFYRNENDTSWIRFDVDQTALINATESLSLLLETQVNGNNYHEMKRKINDIKTFCKGLHRVLFSHVQDGFENGSWTKTL